MNCPMCGAEFEGRKLWSITDSRPYKNEGIVRTRRCRECGASVRTLEVIVRDHTLNNHNKGRYAK